MSFTENAKGETYAPGYFLAHEECERKTKEIPQSLATTVGTTKYVKMGTPYPSNDGDIEGIVYEDVDVTTGNMPGSVVLEGSIVVDRLPVKLTTAAVNKLSADGFKLVTMSPVVTRPY